MPKPANNDAVHELARKAYEFIARRPSYPLARALRSKAAAALSVPPLASPLELKMLLESAEASPDTAKRAGERGD